jgi:hypothetical protein
LYIRAERERLLMSVEAADGFYKRITTRIVF